MMSSIQSMLEHYQPKTAEAYRNALKEIVHPLTCFICRSVWSSRSDGMPPSD